MSRSGYVYLLAALAIVGGVLLLAIDRGQVPAGLLIAGGLGVLGREVKVVNGEKREAQEAYEREAETTTVLRRKLAQREGNTRGS